jgi:hypothetical protein
VNETRSSDGAVDPAGARTGAPLASTPGEGDGGAQVCLFSVASARRAGARNRSRYSTLKPRLVCGAHLERR